MSGSGVPLLAEEERDKEDEKSKTFVFQNEGHTLGNVLTSLISRYTDVQFCGYTVPHPAENKMHLRIQTNKNSTAIDVLRRGLEDLEKVCDLTITRFEESIRTYNK